MAEEETDARPEPMVVAEFEGEYVREMVGRFPALTLTMAEGYTRGTHLMLGLEVRVRNVRYEEDRKGDLSRVHVFALEEAKIYQAFDPAQQVTNVGGTAAGDAWVPALLAYVRGETTTIEADFDEEEIPERLKLLIEESELREAYGKSPEYTQDPDAEPIMGRQPVFTPPEAGF